MKIDRWAKRILSSVKSMATKAAILFALLTLTLKGVAEDYGGAGIVLESQPNSKQPLRIMQVIPGSPAGKAGIKTNWFLISVDGTNVVTMPLAQTVCIARGPFGTSVTLGLADPARNQTNIFTVKRDTIVASKDNQTHSLFYDPTARFISFALNSTNPPAH